MCSSSGTGTATEPTPQRCAANGAPLTSIFLLTRVGAGTGSSGTHPSLIGPDRKVVLELQPTPDFLSCSTTLSGPMFSSTTTTGKRVLSAGMPVASPHRWPPPDCGPPAKCTPVTYLARIYVRDVHFTRLTVQNARFMPGSSRRCPSKPELDPPATSAYRTQSDSTSCRA